MKCKHCLNDFNVPKNTFANHVRWCNKNPKFIEFKKDNIERGKKLGIIRFGDYKYHSVSCTSCLKIFEVREREKLFPSKDKYFCSRSCANSMGGKSKSIKYHSDDFAHYTTVAFRYHKRMCCVCGEDKMVSVHHYDENHKNNDPKNLVPLCPTHHHYMHSRHRSEIDHIVKKYIEDKWAVGVVGGTRALQA